MNRYPKLILPVRIVEILIGTYFLVGALPKGMDIDKFAVQIAAYKVIVDPTMLLYTALFTLFVEVALGISMITGLRLKGLVILAMEAMLIFFAVLIVYAWKKHGLEDCGCFPFFKMSPEVSLIKNAILVIAGVLILYVRRKSKSPEDSSSFKLEKRKTISLSLKLLIAVICGAVATAYAYQDIDWNSMERDENNKESASYTQFELYLPEGYFNLGEGTYLVAVMSMTCDECMADVPDLNALMAIPDIPLLVALCYEDVPGDMDKFRAYTAPEFPMHSLGNRAMLYYSLIGQDSFRLSLVHNGTALKSWDGHVPAYEEIIQAKDALIDQN